MKPIDVTSDSFAEYNEDSNNKNLKFKIGDHVRISKYKNILAKGYTPNWSDKIFVINKLKNTVPWTYAISDLNGEELSNVVKNDVIKKTEQNKLVNKVNNIDTSDFVIKTNYNTKILKLLNQKIKFLILVVLLKRLIIILKSLNQKIKFQILVI